jgi:hypothetical protein
MQRARRWPTMFGHVEWPELGEGIELFVNRQRSIAR